MKFLLVSLSPVEVRAGILKARCYLSLGASSFDIRHSTRDIRYLRFEHGGLLFPDD